MSTNNSPSGDRGKVAIVTGGGSGIGLAIAEKFISAGIHTIIVGRDEQKLKAAKEQFGELCYPMPCDINNLSAIILKL